MWGEFDKFREELKNQYENANFECGIPLSELEEKVRAIMARADEISIGRAKAEAIAFILRNAEIGITENDFFQDMINCGTVMGDLLLERKRAVLGKCTEDAVKISVTGRKIRAFRNSIDYGHTGPDWDIVMKKGIPGILSELRERRESTTEESTRDFYSNSITVYEAIIDFLLRLARLAEEKNTEKTRFSAELLKNLTKSAPSSLAEAMELTLIFYRLQTKLDCLIVRTLGGIDRLYYPFYRSDIESGRYTDKELRELTRDFLAKICAMKVIANVPLYIGGKMSDGSDATNPYTRVLLEEYRALDIFDPKIHVMYHTGMDIGTLHYILEMIREGKSSFVFINVDVAEKALLGIGIESEDAKRVTVYGCYETAAEGTEIPATCAGEFNLAKAFELALYNGCDPLTGRKFGPETGEDFESFENFLAAVKVQMNFMLDACMETIAIYERLSGDICPSPIISATYKNSMENGVDLYAGGAKYNNTSIVGAGLATLIDSLLALEKCVFIDKRISLAEMRECLSKNWVGYEDLLSYCKSRPKKYGNRDKRADTLTKDIVDFFTDKVNNRKNGFGGVFRAGLFSVDWRFYMGKSTGATPCGRRAGEPLSKNAAASIGQDKCGVTAYLGTLLSFDHGKLPDGCVADVVLHESAVKGEDGLSAFFGILLAYMKAGGSSIHFNVLNPDVLRRAQKEPEKYKNLQIRLCGWNVYFVDLTKEEQDEFIIQSSLYGN